MTRDQWIDAAAAFYFDALGLAAMPSPEDEDHDGSSSDCDDYWELSDKLEEIGAGAGLTAAEMTALITAADREHDGCASTASIATIADLIARRFSP